MTKITTDVPGVALITGAGSGIGQAIAHTFLASGCTNIALLDINENGLKATKQQLLDASQGQNSIKIETFQCDVTQEKSVSQAYANAKEAFGRIDYSVQSAGIFNASTGSAEMSVDDFDRQNNINYRGLWLCCRAAIQIMKDQPLDCEAFPDMKISSTRAQRGAIVNISSGLGVLSMPNCPAYCGAKAGVLGITRSDAIDYVGHRIRVNAVLPGVIDTPMTKPTEEVRAFMLSGPVQRTPMKRFGLPEEIADVVVFLAGIKASFITGASIPVDGGHTAT